MLIFFGYVKFCPNSYRDYLLGKSHYKNIIRKHCACKPSKTRILFEQPMLAAGIFIGIIPIVILQNIIGSNFLKKQLIHASKDSKIYLSLI
jgi:hypothetical protein